MGLLFDGYHQTHLVNSEAPFTGSPSFVDFERRLQELETATRARLGGKVPLPHNIGKLRDQDHADYFPNWYEFLTREEVVGRLRAAEKVDEDEESQDISLIYPFLALDEKAAVGIGGADAILGRVGFETRGFRVADGQGLFDLEGDIECLRRQLELEGYTDEVWKTGTEAHEDDLEAELFGRDSPPEPRPHLKTLLPQPYTPLPPPSAKSHSFLRPSSSLTERTQIMGQQQRIRPSSVGSNPARPFLSAPASKVIEISPVDARRIEEKHRQADERSRRRAERERAMLERNERIMKARERREQARERAGLLMSPLSVWSDEDRDPKQKPSSTSQGAMTTLRNPPPSASALGNSHNRDFAHRRPSIPAQEGGPALESPSPRRQGLRREASAELPRGIDTPSPKRLFRRPEAVFPPVPLIPSESSGSPVKEEPSSASEDESDQMQVAPSPRSSRLPGSSGSRTSIGSPGPRCLMPASSTPMELQRDRPESKYPVAMDLDDGPPSPSHVPSPSLPDSHAGRTERRTADERLQALAGVQVVKAERRDDQQEVGRDRDLERSHPDLFSNSNNRLTPEGRECIYRFLMGEATQHSFTRRGFPREPGKSDSYAVLLHEVEEWDEYGEKGNGLTVKTYAYFDFETFVYRVVKRKKRNR